MVIGVMSMLLYNYYTSSVVSWLLNAAAPSISNLDGLINSDFEIIFEDIGYTRGWLDVRLSLFYHFFEIVITTSNALFTIIICFYSESWIFLLQWL